MSEPLIIVGAGGHGRETAYAYLLDHPASAFLGFLDDGPDAATPEGWPVLGPVDRWTDHRQANFAIAVNDPRARRSVVARMRTSGDPRWALVTHPDVRVHASVTLGVACMILGGAQLTTNSRIGDFCIVNRAAQVSHDCVVGSFVSLNPCACIAGRVRIDDGCELGSGCAVRQGVTIGEGAVVGLGAAVIADTPACTVVAGTPATRLRDAAPW